jgi:hypothetical protein
LLSGPLKSPPAPGNWAALAAPPRSAKVTALQVLSPRQNCDAVPAGTTGSFATRAFCRSAWSVNRPVIDPQAADGGFAGCHEYPFQTGDCPICAPFCASCDQLMTHEGLGGREVISTVPISRLSALVGTSQ